MSEDQGWTIGTLKEYLDCRMEAMDRQNEALFAEMEKRSDQRFRSQEAALAKAEAATEKRFEGVNEFRAQMGDQQRTLMPRAESEGLHNATREHLAALVARIDRMEGHGTGKVTGWGLAVGAAGILIALITLALRFIPVNVPGK